MRTFRHKNRQYQITSEVLVDAMGEKFVWAKPINLRAWGVWRPIPLKQQKPNVWHLKVMPEGQGIEVAK